MSKYLVTGGAGFIGSNIVKRLLDIGCSVRVVDNLSTGKFENMKEFINNIEFICGDLSNFDIAQSCVEGIDYVIHQAAIPSVQRSISDPIATNRSIVTSTVNLLEAVSRSRTVKRFIQASSSSVYGDTEVLPKREDMLPNPLSPYAVAKLTQEYYGKAFFNVSGKEVVSLRYFNVFGPRQDPDSFYSAVIPKFVKLMIKGKRPTIYGDGTSSRDFTYIDNVVEANILACKCKLPNGFEVINIGTQKSISLNDLVKEINSFLKTDIIPMYSQPRIGDVKHSLADISKAVNLLGYRLVTPFNDGLKKLVNHLNN